MINRTKAVFDATASTYDADRSRLIPGCDNFYRWAIDLIPAGAKNILDLGAGSGLLTILIRNRFPNARIHLIDFSTPMLSLAGDRLGNDRNITYQHANYVTESLPDTRALQKGLRLAPPQRRLHQRRTGGRSYSCSRRTLQSPLASAGARLRSYRAANHSIALSPAGRPLRYRRRPASLAARSRLCRCRLLVQGQPFRGHGRHARIGTVGCGAN